MTRSGAHLPVTIPMPSGVLVEHRDERVSDRLSARSIYAARYSTDRFVQMGQSEATNKALLDFRLGGSARLCCSKADCQDTPTLRTLATRLNVVHQSMVMKPVVLFIGAAATLWATVVACAETAHQSVAGHQFEVPKDHLFSARIAWLPAPKSDSFTFLFEPNPDPDRIPRHSVLVQPLKGLCNGSQSEIMRVACGAERPLVDASPEYERRPNELGSWSSDLFIVQRDARNEPVRRQQVAYCQLFEPNPARPKPMNLCTTLWGYKGMLLQLDFEETEVNRLQEMKAQAMRMLDSWEVR